MKIKKTAMDKPKNKQSRYSEFDLLYSHYAEIQTKINKLSMRKSTFNILKEVQSLKRQQINVLRIMLKKEINKYFN